MAEEKKCEEVLNAIREKNVISFKSVYYSMHKPLEEIHHRKIVLHSVKNCFTEGIRILINENGADVNDTHEETGKTVLQLAIESDADRDVVKGIVQLGADLGRKDKRGNTALYYLKYIGLLATVSIFSLI